jgi:hypothetical protein
VQTGVAAPVTIKINDNGHTVTNNGACGKKDAAWYTYITLDGLPATTRVRVDIEHFVDAEIGTVLENAINWSAPLTFYKNQYEFQASLISSGTLPYGSGSIDAFNSSDIVSYEGLGSELTGMQVYQKAEANSARRSYQCTSQWSVGSRFTVTVTYLDEGPDIVVTNNGTYFTTNAPYTTQILINGQ